MKSGRVVPLCTQHAFGARVLQRIVAHQGFHTVERDGYTGDALRVILSDQGLGHELLQMYVVFIDFEEHYIAKVECVTVSGEFERDLLLGPFGEFNQTGPGGSIVQPGVHMLFGAIHTRPEFRVRKEYQLTWSYRPRHVLPRPA